MLLERVMLIAVSYLLSSDKQLWKQLSCTLLVTPKPGLLHVNNTLLHTPLAKWGLVSQQLNSLDVLLRASPESRALQQHHTRRGRNRPSPGFSLHSSCPLQGDKKQ